MTQNEQDSGDKTMHDAAEFARNITEASKKYQIIFQEFLSRQSRGAAHPPVAPMHMAGAFTQLFTQMLSDPARLVESQMSLWQDYLHLWQNTAQRLLGVEEPEPVITPESKDKRFKASAWEESTLFDFVKQSYLLTARWILRTVNDVEGMDTRTARKIDFYTRQFVDALAPSNFMLTNPEVLLATIESNGVNLVNGLNNIMQDLERGQGNLRISMTDLKAFEIGRNLALTPGKVVFQNDLMQLIQYEPKTEQVHRTPLLIIPAWINKFYILDLQHDNSLVRWMVEQGYTVFVISWVNPDEKLSRKRFDDYMLEGPLAAMDVIEQVTGEPSLSAIGYCLGGTLLSVTTAYLHAKGKDARLKSCTYLTTMIDFTEAGELSVFIDEEQITALENRMSQSGYLEGTDMGLTFNMLRANDLIWSFVINNYLLGKDPFPFDLLYWNSDSTRMPAAMHSFYLRNMYHNNLLREPDGISLDDTPIDLRRIATPSYFLSTREDHIAPWKSTYAATQILQTASVTFALAASGHIAGVINPPNREKHCFWTNSELPAGPDAWLEHAKEQKGSWWPHWQQWHAPFAGDKVKARTIGGDRLKPIEDAPGSYVKSVA